MAFMQANNQQSAAVQTAWSLGPCRAAMYADIILHVDPIVALVDNKHHN